MQTNCSAILSVVGLNFDYVFLNFTGFFCYTVFNLSLYFSPFIKELYEGTYKYSQIPVSPFNLAKLLIKVPINDEISQIRINDVVFSMHALGANVSS